MPRLTPLQLYRLRRIGIVLGLALPVFILGGIYLLVTNVLLVPAIPDDHTPGDKLARFLIHEKGLPRLSHAEQEQVLARQMARLGRDEALRNAFLAELRIATADEAAAVRNHFFDVFKPILMRDIEGWQSQPPQGRETFLDERIVQYNRLGAYAGNVRVSKDDLGPVAVSPEELLKWLMSKTTERERQLGWQYLVALKARIDEINADPALLEQFKTRIAAAASQPASR